MREGGIPIPDELRTGTGRFRVLIVDDEAAVRDSLASRLSANDTPYDVLTAADGYEAGRMVATFRPDFVVLDLRMPGLDGFQVCRSIKADPQTASTTVVAITGFHTPETEARVLECGAERCLAKPVAPSEIAAVLDLLRERGGANARRRRTVRG